MIIHHGEDVACTWYIHNPGLSLKPAALLINVKLLSSPSFLACLRYTTAILANMHVPHKFTSSVSVVSSFSTVSIVNSGSNHFPFSMIPAHAKAWSTRPYFWSAVLKSATLSAYLVTSVGRKVIEEGEEREESSPSAALVSRSPNTTDAPAW